MHMDDDFFIVPVVPGIHAAQMSQYSVNREKQNVRLPISKVITVFQQPLICNYRGVGEAGPKSLK